MNIPERFLNQNRLKIFDDHEVVVFIQFHLNVMLNESRGAAPDIEEQPSKKKVVVEKNFRNR